MQNKLIKIFQKARYEESHDLAQNIWLTIVKREKFNTRLKLWIFTSIGLASLLGLVPAFKKLSNDLAQSGFYEYFSLAFSDGLSHLSYWKEIIFSIVESLPTTSILLSLSLIFIFFLSIKYVAKQIINNNSMGKAYGIT